MVSPTRNHALPVVTAYSMSGPPTPRAAQLNAPALQVCESAFTSTVPGSA